MCQEAFLETQGHRSATLELVGRGLRVRVPIRNRNRKHRKKDLTPEQVRRKKQAEKAKAAARRRLAAMFPDLYDVLLAEERGDRGLEPWTTDMAVRGRDATVELGFAEALAELDQRGVDTR